LFFFFFFSFFSFSESFSYSFSFFHRNKFISKLSIKSTATFIMFKWPSIGGTSNREDDDDDDEDGPVDEWEANRLYMLDVVNENKCKSNYPTVMRHLERHVRDNVNMLKKEGVQVDKLTTRPTPFTKRDLYFGIQINGEYLNRSLVKIFFYGFYFKDYTGEASTSGHGPKKGGRYRHATIKVALAGVMHFLRHTTSEKFVESTQHNEVQRYLRELMIISRKYEAASKTAAGEQAVRWGVGKDPITFGGFRRIALAMINRLEEKSRQSRQSEVFAHCFHVTQWNCIARTEDIAKIHMGQILAVDDCLRIEFPWLKTRKSGVSLFTHLFANPLDPSICVFLSLAVYMFGYRLPNLAANLPTEEFRLFHGSSISDKYRAAYNKAVQVTSPEDLGTSRTFVSTYSDRKGACDFVLENDGGLYTHVAKRMDHSLGSANDAYMHQSPAGDKKVGRVVAGLPVELIDFLTLPPHFATADDVAAANEFIYKHVTPAVLDVVQKDVLLLLLASLVYHLDFVIKTFPARHPIFSTFYYVNGDLGQLAAEHRPQCGIHHNPTSGLKASGRTSLAQMALQQHSFLKEQRDFMKELRSMYGLNDTGGRVEYTGGENGLYITEVLTRLRELEAEQRDSKEKIIALLDDMPSQVVDALDNRDPQQVILKTYMEKILAAVRGDGREVARSPPPPVDSQPNAPNEGNYRWDTFGSGTDLSPVPPEFVFPQGILSGILNSWLYGNPNYEQKTTKRTYRIRPYHMIASRHLKKAEKPKRSKALRVITRLQEVARTVLDEELSHSNLARVIEKVPEFASQHMTPSHSVVAFCRCFAINSSSVEVQ